MSDYGEPWEQEHDGRLAYRPKWGGLSPVQVTDNWNRRKMLCVNALAGVSDEALQSDAGQGIDGSGASNQGGSSGWNREGAVGKGSRTVREERRHTLNYDEWTADELRRQIAEFTPVLQATKDAAGEGRRLEYHAAVG